MSSVVDSRPENGADDVRPKAERAALHIEERGWTGRITAAIVGGSLLSFAVGLVFSIYWPGADGLDNAFQGGLWLVLVWPVVMIWVLFARSGWRAWLRVALPFVVLMAANVAGLLL